MSESPGWQFAVEVHPADWHFPAGKTWIAGWLWAGEHRFATDLRAWLDGRPILGLHGLPKPGLDEKFLHRPGPPYSGFVILLEPHRGARELRLELRDASGHWHEFFRTPITVDKLAPAAPAPNSLASRLAGLVPDLLRLQTQRPQQALAALADEVISAALAEPLNSLPVPPFHGALEEPRETGWLRYGRLSVTGWLAHRTAKIKRVTALADAVQESLLLHGLPRADVSDVFADLPGRNQSQFIGHVDLPANQSTPALLKIFAELENGEKHLVFAQRFTPRVIAGADIPLPPLSRRTFARAAWALYRSARRHALPTGEPGALLAASRAAWHHYRTEAPARPHQHRTKTIASAARGAAGPLRILLATHNLNFEGAPWFIFELARHLLAQPDVSIRVVCPQEGPMRRVFADAGMPVEVIDLAAAFAAPTPADFDRELAAAGRGLDVAGTDLVLASTMVSFWAVQLANAAHKPSVLYVHESSAIRRFFGPLVAPALFPVIEDSFRTATRVVFTADATRTVFDYLDGAGNFRLLPSWVDVGRIDAFAGTHDKTALRRKHGLDPGAVLLVNIGSVCDRKGQHIFIRAIELLKEELRFTYPERKIQYVMVGARAGMYLDTLKQEVALHGLDQAVFVPETGDIFDFYRLADIFVCTSFEESFPRVLLESAVFRLPIITTNVNGIPEMLASNEAWLIPPGDRYQLGAAMKQALAAHFAGDTTRADRARTAVLKRFHVDQSLPQHLALVREAAAPRA